MQTIWLKFIFPVWVIWKQMFQVARKAEKEISAKDKSWNILSFKLINFNSFAFRFFRFLPGFNTILPHAKQEESNLRFVRCNLIFVFPIFISLMKFLNYPKIFSTLKSMSSAVSCADSI